jgi:hypothetical protein
MYGVSTTILVLLSMQDDTTLHGCTQQRQCTVYCAVRTPLSSALLAGQLCLHALRCSLTVGKRAYCT